MTGLPDPSRSRAVLIGVGRYDSLPPLPAVTNNLGALSEFLTGPNGWRLAPEHCAVLRDPRTSTEVLDAVKEAADSADDALLVYFAGHGLVDPRMKLYLGLPGGRPARPDTGLTYEWLRDAILGGQAQRHVVVLDCCFSGRALGAMSSSDVSTIVDQAQVEGSFLLAAASEDSVALALPGASYTAMTGELLGILRDGIPDGTRWLDLESVYQQLRRGMPAKGWPAPERRNRNTAAQLLLGRNPAHRPTAGPSRRVGTPQLWPDPAALQSADDYVGALGEIRALTGYSQAEIGQRTVPPVTAGAVGALLNRADLPARWGTVARYLEACGLTTEEQNGWQEAWARLRAVGPPPSLRAPVAPPGRRKGLWSVRLGRRNPR